jgi:hypothetical protein
MPVIRLLTTVAFILAALACGRAENPAAPKTDAASDPNNPSPSPQIVQVFELDSIAGLKVPATVGEGKGSFEVAGARYELMSDGTYYFYYIGLPNAPRTAPVGWFVVTDPGTIEFYLSGSVGPFYMERQRHFATGKLTGLGMRVTYEDFIDFYPEVYVRR